MWNVSPLRLSLALSIFALTVSARAQFAVTPGTLIGIGVDDHTLRSYSPEGNLLQSLILPLAQGDDGVFSGLTVLGGQVFISDNGGNVARVDLSTGNRVDRFTILTASDALGDDGTYLLTYSTLDGRVIQRIPGGGFVPNGDYVTAPGGSGLDGDGTFTYLADYAQGSVRKFDRLGTLITTPITGLASNSLSGLGVDAQSGSIWVTSGFGDRLVRRYDANGILRGSFDPGAGVRLNGLDYVPVPEPATLSILGLGALGMIRRSRRRS